MKNYVISLQSAKQRREHINTEFNKHNIKYEFLDAIIPSQLDDIEKLTNIAFSKALKLSAGEKACFASHAILWKKMIDDNIDFLGIFEDDIFLGKDSNQYLNNTDWLNDINEQTSFDIIKIETFLSKTHLSKEYIAINQNRKIKQLKSMHTGTAGYILSLAGARRIFQVINSISADELMPVDHLIFDKFLKQTRIYQLDPAICIQGMFLDQSYLTSELETSRKHIRDQFEKPKKTLMQSIRSTFTRLYRSIAKRTFFSTVDFK